MIEVKYLVNVPPYFANLPNTKRDYDYAYNILRWSVFILSYKKIRKLNVVDFKVHSQTLDDYFYYVSIGTFDKKLSLNSKVKIYCSCPDFAYTFAYVLYKRNALLYPEEFPIEFKTIPPRIRNPHHIPFVCKHVYTVLKVCLEKQIEFSEKEVLKYNKFNKVVRPIFETVFRFYKMMQKFKNKFKKWRRK